MPSIIVNGIPAETISVHDRAFQYGDGVFETLAVVNGKPAQLPAHIKRLKTGLKKLDIRIDTDKLQQEIIQYAKPHESAALKVIVSRGQSQRGYRAPAGIKPNIILMLSEKKYQTEINVNAAIDIQLCKTPLSYNSILAGIKHLNRLEQVLASNEWNDPSIQEGIMCDIDGNVIAATAANIFLWKDNSLVTPDLSQCGIAGTVRQLVLDTAEDLSIPCRIDKCSIDDCHHADALFLTNALAGIKPVKQFESTEYPADAWPQHLYQKVMQHVYT